VQAVVPILAASAASGKGGTVMPHLSPERIGKFEMRVACCALASSPAISPERRVEAVAAWLLAQWRAEHQEGEHVERDD
jgi:hypothetical protein